MATGLENGNCCLYRYLATGVFYSTVSKSPSSTAASITIPVVDGACNSAYGLCQPARDGISLQESQTKLIPGIVNQRRAELFFLVV